MDEQTLQAAAEEVAGTIVGRAWGKVFQTGRLSLAVDFRAQRLPYLFISVEPARPRMYMIARRVRDLEKQSAPQSPFAQLLRKHLGGATVLSVTKDEGERVVRFVLDARDELGVRHLRVLVAQLTGRASNLFLLDGRGIIVSRLRETLGEGQQVGDPYAPPAPQPRKGTPRAAFTRGQFETLSEALDDYYTRAEEEQAFDARAGAARQRLHKEVLQRSKLQRKLREDLAAHGRAEEHKRVGDLLLSNVGTAERRGDTVVVTDYYTEGTPRVELKVDENRTLQEEAARRFARYGKAKRAALEIARRLGELEKEIESLAAREAELEMIISGRDRDALESFFGAPKRDTTRPTGGRKKAETIAGVRRYRSSDGYEILVGRGARDNDHLTFKIARPSDLWLHSADYPGSHVVVRNPTRGEVPQRTLLEAAQLAANYSQARSQSKVDVHYTQRKYLSKPKGAAPGLVRMSSFRTIAVEPREAAERV
ncbi:MAG TPA: NFACT family protein [Pyrinomonadaceae bacterium]